MFSSYQDQKYEKEGGGGGQKIQQSTLKYAVNAWRFFGYRV